MLKTRYVSLNASCVEYEDKLRAHVDNMDHIRCLDELVRISAQNFRRAAAAEEKLARVRGLARARVGNRQTTPLCEDILSIAGDK